MPRCLAARRLNSAAIRLNASQSVFVSQGGGIAALKGCTNGCRSVLERSCFSYQVAAGRTTSEYTHEPFMRKSIVVNRSSLPTGASSLPLDVARALLGRRLGAAHGGVGDAEQVAEEVLVALSGGAEQVGAP